MLFLTFVKCLILRLKYRSNKPVKNLKLLRFSLSLFFQDAYVAPTQKVNSNSCIFTISSHFIIFRSSAHNIRGKGQLLTAQQFVYRTNVIFHMAV